MLRIRGTRRTLCDGIDRRELLQIGGLAGLGLTGALANPAASAESKTAASPDPSFGRAKSCIFLFPYGSPSSHETFDPKPDAPADIQGEMKAISTNVPGLAICDQLPRTAQVMDQVTVVRSMTHPYPVHERQDNNERDRTTDDQGHRRNAFARRRHRSSRCLVARDHWTAQIQARRAARRLRGGWQGAGGSFRE